MVKKSELAQGAALATVTVAGWTLDNAGNYHKAGTELTVDDEGGEGCIDSARAADLVAVEATRVRPSTDGAAPGPCSGDGLGSAEGGPSTDEQTGDA